MSQDYDNMMKEIADMMEENHWEYPHARQFVFASYWDPVLVERFLREEALNVC